MGKILLRVQEGKKIQGEQVGKKIFLGVQMGKKVFRGVQVGKKIFRGLEGLGGWAR